MNKKIGIIFVLLFFSISFCGCISENTPPIVGKWKQIDSDITMIFKDNGRLHIISNTTINSVNYELNEENTIKVFLDDNIEYWEYIFLDDATLQLRILGNSSWEILERIE